MYSDLNLIVIKRMQELLNKLSRYFNPLQCHKILFEKIKQEMSVMKKISTER